MSHALSLFLNLLVPAADAGIYIYYDLSRFIMGNCTPIKVEVGRKVGRIGIGAGIFVVGEAPPQQEVAFVQDDVSTLDVCWPDEVGRYGSYPTTLTILEDFNPGVGPTPLYWVVTDWTVKTHSVSTEFGTVLVTIGTSRAIIPPK